MIGSLKRRNIGYVTEPRWLLLGHQLPTRSSNARVKTWRRLQQLGAVAARNSVYVLPNTEQYREDFEWMRSEIVALGGEATVFAADAISEGGTDDIVATFRQAREHEYRALKTEIDRLVRSRARRQYQLITRGGGGSIASGVARPIHGYRTHRLFRGAHARRSSRIARKVRGGASRSEAGPRRDTERSRSGRLPCATLGDATAAGHRSHGVSLVDSAVYRPECHVRFH